MFALILLAAGAEPAPRFTVENKVPPAFVVVNRVAPAADRFRATDGVWYERGADGWYRPAPAPEVATPKGVTFPSGCGCSAGFNCGASFCKSRGGTGCPASCPVRH